MSIGSSKSSGGGTTYSGMTSYGTQLLPSQQTGLEGMWQQGANLATQGAGQDIGYAGMGAANAATNNMGAAMGGMNQGMQTLGRLQNPGMDPMMGVYAKQLGQQFNEQIMPGLRTQGIETGAYGGSRAGIAQGMAGARMGQQLQDFGAQLYGANQDRAAQAAAAQGGLAGQAGQLYGQQAGQYLQNAGFGMGVPWYAMQQYSGLLGQPILENLGATSSSSGSTRSSGSGWSFGI